MPNWCMNEMRISGESKELKRFLDASIGLPAKYPPVCDLNGEHLFKEEDATEPHFCFNALVPTPQEILDIGFDGHYIKNEDGSPVLDGYEWSIENWGTKWDIYGDNITLESIGWYEGCESIEFGFDTAWSPPEGWFAAAVRMFPALHFELHYEEPGCYFAGDFDGESGCYSDYEYNEEECKEAFSWIEDYDTEEME